jgi:hypothetical protein
MGWLKKLYENIMYYMKMCFKISKTSCPVLNKIEYYFITYWFIVAILALVALWHCGTLFFVALVALWHLWHCGTLVYCGTCGTVALVALWHL